MHIGEGMLEGMFVLKIYAGTFSEANKIQADILHNQKVLLEVWNFLQAGSKNANHETVYKELKAILEVNPYK